MMKRPEMKFYQFLKNRRSKLRPKILSYYVAKVNLKIKIKSTKQYF